ncbi:MAG: cell division protein FtsH, partial [Microgenomates group bacterium]
LIPPEKDKLHETKNHLLQRIAVMMGGRAAEDLIFKEVTTGAANDFDQATSVAKAMVMEYGMSTLGPINLGPSYDVTEMGKATWQENPLSQETMSLIDKEVKAILAEGYKKATEIIKVHKKELDKVAKELLAKESLDQDEFEQLVGKKKQNIVNS